MASECFHCGEAIPPGFRANLTIKGSLESFCCYGCQAVAEIIQSDGLDNFYSHRTELSLKPDELSSNDLEQLKLYDDALLQEEFVKEYEGVSQASLSIAGITCAACIWLRRAKGCNIQFLRVAVTYVNIIGCVLLQAPSW